MQAVDEAQRIGVAWRELRRGASMTRLKERFQSERSIEIGQLDALDLLVARGEAGLRMGDLADALRVDASTATRAVDRLVQAGFAERTTDPEDGRRVLARVSDKGEALHRELAQGRRDMLDRMLQGFSERERRDLADLMERFVHALDELVAEEDW